MKQNKDNWKENFDKEFGDYDVEGLFWRDTEQYKIVIDFIYTHKKQWEEEAVQAEREREIITKDSIKNRIIAEQTKHGRLIDDWQELAARKLYGTIKENMLKPPSL